MTASRSVAALLLCLASLWPTPVGATAGIELVQGARVQFDASGRIETAPDLAQDNHRYWIQYTITNGETPRRVTHGPVALLDDRVVVKRFDGTALTFNATVSCFRDRQHVVVDCTDVPLYADLEPGARITTNHSLDLPRERRLLAWHFPGLAEQVSIRWPMETPSALRDHFVRATVERSLCVGGDGRVQVATDATPPQVTIRTDERYGYSSTNADYVEHESFYAASSGFFPLEGRPFWWDVPTSASPEDGPHLEFPGACARGFVEARRTYAPGDKASFPFLGHDGACPEGGTTERSRQILYGLDGAGNVAFIDREMLLCREKDLFSANYLPASLLFGGVGILLTLAIRRRP